MGKSREIHDLTGQRFGRLLAIERIFKNRTYWLCKCDCGNEKIIREGRLLRKESRSCGCLRNQMLKNMSSGENYDGTMFPELLRKYKNEAKRRKYSFEISPADFKILTKGNCVYCNSEPKTILKSRFKSLADYIYNGIDRVDNTKGYIYDNVVSCCKYCNQAKNSMTEDEWFQYRNRLSLCFIKQNGIKINGY